MNFHEAPLTYASQITLKVSDLERSILFYKEIIGLKVLREDTGSAELTADGKTVLIVLVQPPAIEQKSARSAGLYHFALLLPDRPSLASALAHLIQAGWPLQGASDHLVSEAIYLADPDGNGIEIYADRPTESWTWEGGMVRMDTAALHAGDLLAMEEKMPWKGIPGDTIMGHIHLHVSDLKAAEEFYVKGLGFNIAAEYGGQALFLSTGNYHHHIGINTWNGIGAPPARENAPGMKDFKLLYPDTKSIRAAAERIRKLGQNAEIQGELVLTADPSGNRIILSL
ncbi:VOC family protein [Bacillus infantis]|uniref:VOC family protein n=1 Tax=Bacillus infantis TaxID=324767 RepID=UPI001CD2CD79|nr:VOC family protein [Bacillus infantis]MCA1034924.1 VOC family protein [Bacillus infantis]